MNDSKHLFFLMNHFFIGIGLSLLYGCVTTAIVWWISDFATFQAYHHAFFIGFNCVFSGGLIASAAILVYKTQQYLPTLIEDNFDQEALSTTEYHFHKNRFFKLSRSLSFVSTFVVVGFGVFYFARFPFDGIPEYFMIAYGCMQYGLGVYVGRKLFYITQMVQCLERLPVGKELFRDDKLGGIITYVNSISTLTVIFVFIHVTSYYHAPFEFDSIFGGSLQVLLLLPAVIATPVVVLFNFYPRTVLRKLYARSISVQIEDLGSKLRNEHLSNYEKMAYAIEYDKVSQDELKYKLRISLSDLPIAITIFVMLLSLFF